ARVARERFGVERVIARIYDAGRAEVYERLGIPTVATVPWATGRLFRYVTDSAGPVDWRDQTGAVSLVALAAPHAWVGARVDDLAAAAGGRAAALSRFGRCRVPDARDLVQADDLLHLAVPTDTVETLESTLGEGAPAERRDQPARSRGVGPGLRRRCRAAPPGRCPDTTGGHHAGRGGRGGRGRSLHRPRVAGGGPRRAAPRPSRGRTRGGRDPRR